MENTDRTYMQRALSLAPRGRGAVEPNPMVGAVLVKDGQVLGEGWHERYGEPHAERNAIDAARQAGADLRGATLYVTLEPCCHHGKTPPCTRAIIEAGIRRVVTAMVDPDEHVAGKGVRVLREAGLAVDVGVCGEEARELLAPYSTLRLQGRPWVLCKWARTADGFLALPPEEGRWITGEAARQYVHEVRSRCDGILVGLGTVLADDPMLNNRSGAGKQPVRVVLDAQLRLEPTSKLVRTAFDHPLLVVAEERAVRTRGDHAERLRAAGAEILPLREVLSPLGLRALLAEFGKRRWTVLLVEGGARVLRCCLEAGRGDELMEFISPKTVNKPTENLPRLDLGSMRREETYALFEKRRFGDDELRRYRRKK